MNDVDHAIFSAASCEPQVSSEGPTASEVLVAIEGWTDLRTDRRSALASAVRKAAAIQAAVGRQDAGQPRFTCEALNHTLWRRAPACFGIHSPAGFNNLVSACRAVLMRLGLHAPKVARLSPNWEILLARLPTRERRLGVGAFVRYCGLYSIAPSAVTAATLDDFEAWATGRILKRDIGGMVRATASGWNWAKDHVPGWPQVRLARRDMREQFTLPLDEYPASFQEDAWRFLDGLAADPLEKLFTGQVFTTSGTGPRSRPKAARPRTVQTRRDQIRAAAAGLVLSGIPIGEITSLRDLVDPIPNFEKIVNFHYRRRRQRQAREDLATRPSQLLGIIETLRQVAKFHCRLPDAHVAHIAQVHSMIAPRSQMTMTDVNQARLQALLVPEVYARLLHLPGHLMAEAEKLWEQAKAKAQPGTTAPPPAKAARLVMFAVAIEILTFCPLRRHNLVQLNLILDLVRDPRGRITALRVAGADAKNGEFFEWQLADSTAKLLATWLKIWRPSLAEEGNPHLFPGLGQNARDESEFGTALAKLVESRIGALFNLHLARHFSVVRYLRAFPGHYATVSRLLGHRKIETTIRFYAGLEANAAALQVNRSVLTDRARTKPAASTAFGSRRKSKPASRQLASGD